RSTKTVRCGQSAMARLSPNACSAPRLAVVGCRMLNALLVAAGLFVGIALPRWRAQALIAFAELTGIAVVLAAALAAQLRIGTGAALLASMLAGGALLAALVPRVALFFLLSVALAGNVPVASALAHPALAIAAAVVVLAGVAGLSLK